MADDISPKGKVVVLHAYDGADLKYVDWDTIAGLSTEATLELVRLLLVSVASEDFATQTTLNALLTELKLKADLTDTQPVSLASAPTTAVTVADGSDVVGGAVADAAVVAGAAGTVSAKLRRLTTDLDALLTELKLKADLTETQPISVEGYDPVPTEPAYETQDAVTVNNLSWTTVASLTAGASSTLWVTDIILAQADGAAGAEFIVRILIGAGVYLRVRVPAGGTIHLAFKTPLRVLTTVTLSLSFFQWSGGALTYTGTIIGYET